MAPRHPIRRWTVRLLVVVLLGWAVLWVVLQLTADRLLDRAVERLVARATAAGIEIDAVEHGGVRVSPLLAGATVREVRLRFDLHPGDSQKLRSALSVESLHILLTKPLSLRGRVRAEGFTLQFHSVDLPKEVPFDRFEDGRISLHGLPLGNPRAAIKETLNGLRELFSRNESAGPFEFEGTVEVEVDGASVPARLFTERHGRRFRLRFDPDDIRALAAKSDIPLSGEQVEIISLYPLRVPVLLVLTARARSNARSAFPSDNWKRDALSHIGWSYLLAGTFGSQFAKRVTDSYEALPGNTRNERLMDLHNNALGRRFAAQKVPFASLAAKVRSDPDVIRRPAEVPNRRELLR